MSEAAIPLSISRTERGSNPSFFQRRVCGPFAPQTRRVFKEPGFAIFLFNLTIFVQYAENPKNIILGLDKIRFMLYNKGTNKEEVNPMEEHLIRFLDNRLELAKASTATRSLVRTYETQAFGALVCYCEACYYENLALEEESLNKLWDNYYRPEFFNAWLEKAE